MDSLNGKLTSVTPILRIFEDNKAKEFYLSFLEFQLDWEHRFEEGAPLYMQVSRDQTVLHLSEHHGDCCPGSAIRIQTENIAAFHERLLSKNYAYAKPGLETTPWGTLEVSVTDPFGNRLIFYGHPE